MSTFSYSALGSVCAFIALAGCSAPASNEQAATELAPSGTGAASITTRSVSRWDAADACRTLDKAVVADATGSAVESAKLERVTAATSATAGFSQCSYVLADGRKVEFFARKSPIADNTPEAIDQAKNSIAIFTPESPEDVSGVGKAAFWVPMLGQLQFFIGEDRYGFINMPGNDKAKARDAAITLARKVGA